LRLKKILDSFKYPELKTKFRFLILASMLKMVFRAKIIIFGHFPSRLFASLEMKIEKWFINGNKCEHPQTQNLTKAVC
jgi:hypothetical protein